MAYPFEDLDDSQFEGLVVQCARKLFGAGVQKFAKGPDGGRDARFEGVAERFPSSAAPWSGVTIIQAKHTTASNTHFSDPEFSGMGKSATLTEELPRVAALVSAGEIDNYILFANRRLGGVTASAIVQRISHETGLDRSRIFLVGIEYLGDLLHEFPEIVRLAKIDPLDGPLLVSSHDLAEVILAIADALAAPTGMTDAPVVDRVAYDEKNRINKMSVKFADVLSKRYMKYTRQIDDFLANPGNGDVLARYEAAVEEFELAIVAKRKDYQSFDDVFNYLVTLLANRDGVLARKRGLLRALLFYMYWHCDIGETADVDAR